MKKERDYHRQHHNRIAQEKNNLVTFVKRYSKKKDFLNFLTKSFFFRFILSD
jgi:hypothetical protein